MKILTFIFSVAIVFLMLSTSTIAVVPNPAFTISVVATPETMNGKSTLSVDWRFMANDAGIQLRGSSGIRLAYDNTLLQLMRYSGTGADYTLTETLSGMPSAACPGVYEDAVIDVRASRNSNSFIGYVTIELGHPEFTFDCIKNAEQTLASIRFAFREGKSQSNLNSNSIRLVTIEEMESLVQPAAVSISVASTVTNNIEYAYRSRGVADSLNAPEIITGANVNGNTSTPPLLPVEGKPDGNSSYNATITATAFEDILKAGDSFTAETPIANITLDARALEAISQSGSGDVVVTVSFVDVVDLTDKQKDVVGNCPAYDVTITIGEKQITEFQGGKAVIVVPYNLGKDENLNAIIVCCLNMDNTLSLVRGYYRNGTVVFTVKHLSKFIIKHSEKTYADIDKAPAWSKNAVEFVAARDLIVGLAENILDPTKEVTRGEFTASLMRAYGVEPDPTATENFEDIDSAAAYALYIATAKKYGIAEGVGNNKFAPELQITREEMFTLLHRTLSKIGEAPFKSENGKTLSNFTDSDTVAAWAKEAIEALLQAGMVDGTGNDRLSPKLICDRATMAQMIYNLLAR